MATNFTLYGSFILSDFTESAQLSKIFYMDNFSSNGDGGNGSGGSGSGG